MKSLLVGLLGVSMVTSISAQDTPRIYTDTLIATTPDQAVEAFVDRFAARDYMAVYYQLSSEARREMFAIYARDFGFGFFFDAPNQAIPPGSVYDLKEEAQDDILNDPALRFDNVLLHADEAGWLPFGFSDMASITSVDMIEPGALVSVATGSEPAEVQILLTSNALGHWHVDRVLWAGSDSRIRPWGIAAAPDEQ